MIRQEFEALAETIFQIKDKGTRQQKLDLKFMLTHELKLLNTELKISGEMGE